MGFDDYGQITYLTLLLIVLGGSYLVSSRQSLGKTTQYAAIWVLIFVGGVAVVGLWEDLRQTVQPSQQVSADDQIVLPLQRDGHYYATLLLNGVPVEFVVDTGATEIVLSQEDAERIGLSPNSLIFSGTAQTANGDVGVAPVRINSIEFGPFSDSNIFALVNEGELFGSLLGMGYLQRFSKIEIGNNALVLTR